MDAVTLVGGLRLDDHDTFGDEVTGRVGAALKCKQTGGRLKATYGTGFKAPSLYQLYAPASTFGAIGNPDLEPETSQTWDAGVEVPLGAGTTVEVTYFESDYDNLIAFENGYVNESEATIKGVELAATVALCEQTTLGLTYTYTDTEDEDGASLIRRPRNRATADLQWHGHEDVTVNLACVYVGSRRDSFFSSTMFESVEEEMPGSVVVNLAASWDVCDTVTVFGRVENLFDKDYEMVAGYGTPGIAGYGGLRVTL